MADFENYMEFQDSVWAFVHEAQNQGLDTDKLSNDLVNAEGSVAERSHQQLSAVYDFLVDEAKSAPELTRLYMEARAEYTDLVEQQQTPAPVQGNIAPLMGMDR